MKKSFFHSFVSLFLVLILLFCGCAKKAPPPPAVQTTSPHDSSEVYNVAILQFDNDYASNLMRQTFISRMRTLGYDESKMKFDILSCQGNRSVLEKNADLLKNSEYSLTVAVGTLCATAVADTQSTVPCVFIGAADPVANSLVAQDGTPDKNMTGTQLVTSAELLLSVMRVYTTDISVLSVVYDGNVASAKQEAENVRDTLTQSAYTVNLVEVKSGSELSSSTDELCENSDALYFACDCYFPGLMTSAAAKASEKGKPVFSSSEALVASGALMGTATGSEELAKNAALSADLIIRGEAVSSIPVNSDSEIKLFANRNTLQQFKIETPKNENLVLI